MSCATTSWLPAFVGASNFFSSCARCSAAHTSREATLNYWDCNTQEELCSVCVAEHPRDSVIQVSMFDRSLVTRPQPHAHCVGHTPSHSLACGWFTFHPHIPHIRVSPHPQVRRSSYHDVVKVADMARLADISGIQSYVINGSKVLFLRRRPQPRPPKGAIGASLCTICSRHLQDVSLYCSIQCKLDSQAGVKHVSLRTLATTIPSTQTQLQQQQHMHANAHMHNSNNTSQTDSGSSATRVSPSTPSHAVLGMMRSSQIHIHHLHSSDGSESDTGSDSHMSKRRKGLPHRAPTE